MHRNQGKLCGYRNWKVNGDDIWREDKREWQRENRITVQGNVDRRGDKTRQRGLIFQNEERLPS